MRKHPMLHCASQALLVLTLLASTSPSRAQADDDASIAMARERFKEGVQYFDQKQYDKARAAFLQAYALKRHPAVLLNLAQSELRSGHETDAAKHFAQYLREHKEATEVERQGAESGLATAKTSVGELSVAVDEEGANLFVDGSAEGTTPLPGPVYLSPGSHVIAARKEGREATTTVTAVAGQSASTTLRINAPPPPPVTKPPEPKPATGPTESGSAGGQAAVTSESQSFFAWAAKSPVAWVGGGLVVAGLAGGIGFAVGSKQNYDSANSVADDIRQATVEDGLSSAQGICADPALQQNTGRPDEYQHACSKYSDDVDSGDRLKTFSIVSFTVAGVAAAGTIILYFVDGSSSQSSGARPHRPVTAGIAPWASPDTRGLIVHGEF